MSPECQKSFSDLGSGFLNYLTIRSGYPAGVYLFSVPTLGFHRVSRSTEPPGSVVAFNPVEVEAPTGVAAVGFKGCIGGWLIEDAGHVSVSPTCARRLKFDRVILQIEAKKVRSQWLRPMTFSNRPASTGRELVFVSSEFKTCNVVNLRNSVVV